MFEHFMLTSVGGKVESRMLKKKVPEVVEDSQHYKVGLKTGANNKSVPRATTKKTPTQLTQQSHLTQSDTLVC
jgi:hypothetical protein